MSITKGVLKSLDKLSYCLLTIPILLLISCRNDKVISDPIFKSLDASATHLDFSNTLKPTPEFNLFSYMYYYNGAGVGAGDFNNDGWIDLFFAANQADNKIFLNKKGLQFNDVTKQAHIPQDGGWSTGVSIVDINNDGLLDIYVCKVGHYKNLKGKNQLLVCKGINASGIPEYEDKAAEYGLDFTGFSTQALFFDYDGDTDIDMFLLNHSVNHDGNYAPRSQFLGTYDSLAGQRLYKNLSVETGGKQKGFQNVSQQAGINSSRIGYGLGVAAADINMDGYTDLYVGNDFHENDYLYINNKKGGFTDESVNQLMHTSEFSMGVDIADINNDAQPDIVSVDMLPNDPYILKRSVAEDDYNIYQQKLQYGYHYQYARNNLQLNRGNGTFSEVAQYAGVYATDWSWGALWTDFNNDGKKDLFISNGIPRRMNDIDYINFVSNEEIQTKLRTKSLQSQDMALINKFPEIKLPNCFFINKGNLKFEDVSGKIADNPKTFSNGCAYADFDNDGDVDVVVNNINDKPVLYENLLPNAKQSSIAITFAGPENNRNAIGAKVLVYCKNEFRSYENFPVHGFQSSMQGPLLIGLTGAVVDSAMVVWPDNTFEKFNLKQKIKDTLQYKKGLPKFDYAKSSNIGIHYLEDITAQTGIQYKHFENPFNEFDREPLLPHMNGAEGPALAIADINGDGLEDFFIGASKTFQNGIFIQQQNGKFLRSPQPEMSKDSMWENVDAVWADVNGDTFPDLITASGGNEYYGKDRHLLPLVYLNNGTGSFVKDEDAIKDVYTTQSCITAADYNGDGAVDLFVGGRATPFNYGEIPRSYLLQNNGKGRFTDVTQNVASQLSFCGMVTGATWADINKDGKKDLVVCYEWGGIDAFVNSGNKLERKEICNKKGWWTFVKPVDVDNDGDLDIVAGNFGLNSKLQPTTEKPVRMYYNDFDNNGKKEQVVTYYLSEKEIPFATKQELEKQIPLLKKKFLLAEDFAKASLKDLFGSEKLSGAVIFTADDFSSVVLVNNNGRFEVTALPYQAQLSTLKDVAIVDANNDHLPDLLFAGNYYSNNVEIGRNDAMYSGLLINKGGGQFAFSGLNGFIVKDQVRHIAPIKIGKRNAYLFAKNNDTLKVVTFQTFNQKP